MALTWLWLAPLAAGLAVWALPSRAWTRAAALAAAAGLLGYSLHLVVPFEAETGVARLHETLGPAVLGIQYHLSVDGVSLALCWLTALLTVLALAASWKLDVPRAYWSSFLLLEAALMGVFLSQDLFYFYVFWDLALVPMFFIIGLWGHEGRRKAALKFMVYTLLGSLSLLIGIVSLAALHHAATGVWTWDSRALASTPVSGKAALWVYAALALGFGVKVPIVPFHNWLPDAHTEAPTAGSVLLAGSMLKMGVYGFFRILVPVFPDISAEALPWLGALGTAGILYGALCAMAQSDLKRLVAFTSVSHLGFCLVGLYSLAPQGIAGSAFAMVSHGLATGGLFLLVGMLDERCHRRGLSDFGGLASRAPALAFFFGFILLASIGLPGLSGFVGEALSLSGLAKALLPLAGAAMPGAVLAAAYGLPAFGRVFWDPPEPGSAAGLVNDLDLRERAILWTLALLILGLGLCPGPLLSLFQPTALALARR